MQKKHPRKICAGCNRWFTPNPKTAFHQAYCSRQRCKRASKAASQRKWKDKPDNQKLADPVKERERVYRWRNLNPGHWKRAFARFPKGKVVLRRDDRSAG